MAAAAPACADRKEVPMKIVVVKSPKLLTGILRKIFGIKE
ncbi:MAG: stage V sporulation protein SpoVM [Oscillospiraceae bacterium]|nr:stage V sporulation protein SpoVM [Oscillospiraceae bacterium]